MFDMDGLLLDTERIALASFVRTCAHYGAIEMSHVFWACIGSSRSDCRAVLDEAMGNKIDLTAFSEYWDHMYTQMLMLESTQFLVKRGAVDVLQDLSHYAVPLVVVTSNDTDRARWKLRHAGLLRYFDLIIGGETVSRGKPHPDIYLRAVDVLKVRAGKSICFEDSDKGAESALAAGLTVVQVPDLVPSGLVDRDGRYFMLDCLSSFVFLRDRKPLNESSKPA